MATGQQTQGGNKPPPVKFKLKSGERSTLVHEIPSLHVRFAIDPSEVSSHDDKFRLHSDDGSYDKTLTIKDDQVPGDEYLDLIFDNLKEAASYTLEVDPGAQGSPYKVFEKEPFQDLVDYYSILDDSDELDAKPGSAKDNEDGPDYVDKDASDPEWGGDAEDDTDWFDGGEDDGDDDKLGW
ncbi:MAG: hypothetical protein ACE5FH_02475 [Candidatus Zixiibacteriota bacterium]